MAVNEHIEKILKPIGLPIAYRTFKPYKNKPVPAPPYLIYLISNESGRGADGKNLYKRLHIVVELYTTTKNTALEDKVENAISKYEFEKYETYIESEKMWLVSFEFDIFEKQGGINNVE